MENIHESQTPNVGGTSAPQSEKKNQSLPVLGAIVLLVSLVAGGVGYYLGSMPKNQLLPDQQTMISPTTQPNQIACPMDAKICPDGSSVGRSGPNCEFEECANTTNSKKLPTTVIGVEVSSDAEAAINLAVQSYLNNQNITEESLVSEQRQVTFEVHKANPEWFFGMGIVTGSKECTIQPGESECGLPGPSFLIIGHKENNSWETAAEYTTEFTILVQEAPETIVSIDQKSVYR